MIRLDFAPVLPRHYTQAALLLLIGGDGNGDRPTYGYELRDQLTALGVPKTDFGQLYRILRAMEKSGVVLSCWENSEAGPARRTYHVTDKGRAQLAAWVDGMALGQQIVGRFLDRYDAETVQLPAAESA